MAITKAGVDRAVIVNITYPRGLNQSHPKSMKLKEKLRSSNIWACELAQRHKKFEAFIGVDPPIFSIPQR